MTACPHRIISTRKGSLPGRTMLRCQACGLEKERVSSMADLDDHWPELAAEARLVADRDGVHAEKAAASVSRGRGNKHGKTQE